MKYQQNTILHYPRAVSKNKQSQFSYTSLEPVKSARLIVLGTKNLPFSCEKRGRAVQAAVQCSSPTVGLNPFQCSHPAAERTG